MKLKHAWMIYTVSFFMMALAGTPEVQAVEETPKIQIGFGGAASSRLYRDLNDEERYLPIPLIMANYGALFVKGNRLGLTVVGDKRLHADLLLSRSTDGYKASYSPYLTGMEKRKRGYDAGGQITYWSPVGGFTFVGLVDASDTHHGAEATLSYKLPLVTDHFTLVPGFGGTWRDKKKTDYYYGVQDSEAIEGRQAYTPNDSYSGFLSLDLVIPLYDRVTFKAGGRAEYFGDEIRESPIVNEDYSVMMYMGLAVTLL